MSGTKKQANKIKVTYRDPNRKVRKGGDIFADFKKRAKERKPTDPAVFDEILTPNTSKDRQLLEQILARLDSINARLEVIEKGLAKPKKANK